MAAVITGPWAGVVELECTHVVALTVGDGERMADRVRCPACDGEPVQAIRRVAPWPGTNAPEGSVAAVQAYIDATVRAPEGLVGEVAAYLTGMFGESAWNPVAAYHLIGLVGAALERAPQG